MSFFYLTTEKNHPVYLKEKKSIQISLVKLKNKGTSKNSVLEIRPPGKMALNVLK